MYSTLFQTVRYQLFTDMKSTGIPAYCVAGIADMPTADDIIGMKNVQAVHFIRFRVNSNRGISLLCKKFSTGLVISNSF